MKRRQLEWHQNAFNYRDRNDRSYSCATPTSKTWWAIKSYHQWKLKRICSLTRNYKVWKLQWSLDALSSPSPPRLEDIQKLENIFQMMKNDVKHQLCNLMVALNRERYSNLFIFPFFLFILDNDSYKLRSSHQHHQEGCLLSYDSRFDYVFRWTITKKWIIKKSLLFVLILFILMVDAI